MYEKESMNNEKVEKFATLLVVTFPVVMIGSLALGVYNLPLGVIALSVSSIAFLWALDVAPRSFPW